MDLKRPSDDEIQFQKEERLGKDDVEMIHKDDEVQMVDANAYFMVLSIQRICQYYCSF